MDFDWMYYLRLLITIIGSFVAGGISGWFLVNLVNFFFWLMS